MTPPDLLASWAREPKVGRTSGCEGDVTPQWLSTCASKRHHLVVGHSLAQAKDHSLHALGSLHAGVFEIGDFRSRAKSAQAVPGMHKKIGTINNSTVACKLAKRVHKVGRQLDRVLRIRVLVVREILPSHAPYRRCFCYSFSRKDRLYHPALIPRLTEQGKWLEPFPTQLFLAKKWAYPDIRFTFIAHHQKGFAV